MVAAVETLDCDGTPFRGPEQGEVRNQRRDLLVPLEGLVPRRKAADRGCGPLKPIEMVFGGGEAVETG